MRTTQNVFQIIKTSTSFDYDGYFSSSSHQYRQWKSQCIYSVQSAGLSPSIFLTMAPNMSFIQYAAIDFFPSILVVLGAPLLFPFVLAGLIIYHIIRKYVLKTLLKRWSLLDIFERASRNFFDKILYRSKKYPEQYVVSGYRAPRWYIYWLFSLLYGIITFSVALFWDNYFIKETTVCENSNKDQACFSMPQEYSDINWYAYPLTSCEAEANNSLLCFEFAFNLGKATGAAGGVFVAASLILTIITIHNYCSHSLTECIRECPFPCGVNQKRNFLRPLITRSPIFLTKERMSLRLILRLNRFSLRNMLTTKLLGSDNLATSTHTTSP